MPDIKPNSYSELLEIELQDHREMQRVVGLMIQGVEELLKGMRDLATGMEQRERVFADRLAKVKEGERQLAGEEPPRPLLGIVKEGDSE